MIIIPKREIWTRQPQYIWPVSSEIPKPHAVWVPGLGDITGRYDTLREADTTESFGRAYQIPASLYFRKTLVANSSVLPTSGGYSVLVLTRQTGNQQSGGFNVGVVGGGATDRCALSTYDSNLLFLDYGGYTDGSTRVIATGINHIAGTLGCYLATTGPLGMRLFANGSLLASNSANPSKGATTSAFVVGDLYDGITTAHNVGVVAIWFEQLPDGLAAKLSENPWKIIAPQSRHVFVEVGGGGGDVTLDPTTGSVTFSGQTPTITLPIALTPSTGSVAVTGQTPAVTNPLALTPTTGSIVIGGNSPSITLPVALAATTGSVTFTGNQPTVEAGGGVSLTSSTGSVTISGNTPTITLPVDVTSITGSVTLSGNQPTLNTGADVILTPTTGSVVFSGQTASITLPVALTPSVGNVTLSGNAPTITLPVAITPTTGQLVISGNVPVITLGITSTPLTGEIIITGNQPTFSLAVGLTSITGSLVMIGNRPTMTGTSTLEDAEFLRQSVFVRSAEAREFARINTSSRYFSRRN